MEGEQTVGQNQKNAQEPEEESGKKSFMEQAMDAERQSKGNDGE